MKALKPKTETISVPPRPVAGEFCAAINRLNESRADVVAIRAGSLRFLSPLEICGLRALLGYAADLVERVEFECPVDPNVHNYLERMNFYADLPANVTLSRSRPRLRRRDLCEQLIELTPIATVEDVEELMERVNVVARAHSGNRRLAKAFATAVAAAAENVVDHAESPEGAVVGAQRYKPCGLELAVVDLGAGIPATLARNPRHAGLADREAIERSLEEGVSSLGDDRGIGLWEFSENVARAGSSTFGIASGGAEITVSNHLGKSQLSSTTPPHEIVGTWIWVRLAG